ncbi:MAG: ECF-type sigma factor [Acidobacteriota bacterium]
MPESTVTELLRRWREGSDEAAEELSRSVYQELHRLAHHQMRHERQGHLLQTTALVNEAYMRLLGLRVDWRDRSHFFTVAARQMRRVLVDSARRRRAQKRGDDLLVDLETVDLADEPRFEILALDEALDQLASMDRRKARVVELRFFTGLSIRETAEILQISHATVERDLQMAKAWLRREMAGAEA